MAERIESLRLRGDDIQVQYVSPDELGDENEHCDGLYTSHDNLIQIRNDAIGAGLLRTLCHEIVHFFIAWGGLGSQWKHDEDISDGVEEGVADAMGAMLYEVIRDNPDLCDLVRKKSTKCEPSRAFMGRVVARDAVD